MKSKFPRLSFFTKKRKNKNKKKMIRLEPRLFNPVHSLRVRKHVQVLDQIEMVGDDNNNNISNTNNKRIIIVMKILV